MLILFSCRVVAYGVLWSQKSEATRGVNLAFRLWANHCRNVNEQVEKVVLQFDLFEADFRI